MAITSPANISHCREQFPAVLMTITHTPGVLSKFGRTPWGLQTTFGTPLENLESFVSTILPDEGEFEKGSATIDEIVFEPRTLNALLAGDPALSQLSRDWSIHAEGKEHVRELLQSVLSDWIDFLFVPTPKPFVIYADHDEFTTFYASTRSNLNRVVQPLLSKGFKQIPDYQREL